MVLSRSTSCGSSSMRRQGATSFAPTAAPCVRGERSMALAPAATQRSTAPAPSPTNAGCGPEAAKPPHSEDREGTHLHPHGSQHLSPQERSRAGQQGKEQGRGAGQRSRAGQQGKEQGKGAGQGSRVEGQGKGAGRSHGHHVQEGPLKAAPLEQLQVLVQRQPRGADDGLCLWVRVRCKQAREVVVLQQRWPLPLGGGPLQAGQGGGGLDCKQVLRTTVFGSMVVVVSASGCRSASRSGSTCGLTCCPRTLQGHADGS